MKTIKPNILDLYENLKMHIINTFNQILFFINMLWSLLWPSSRCPTDQTLLVKNNNMWLNIFIYVHLLVINVSIKYSSMHGYGTQKNQTELYSFTDTLKQLITENAFTCLMMILYHPLLAMRENPYTIHEVPSQKAFNSKVTDIHTLQWESIWG